MKNITKLNQFFVNAGNDIFLRNVCGIILVLVAFMMSYFKLLFIQIIFYKQMSSHRNGLGRASLRATTTCSRKSSGNIGIIIVGEAVALTKILVSHNHGRLVSRLCCTHCSRTTSVVVCSCNRLGISTQSLRLVLSGELRRIVVFRGHLSLVV